MLNQCFGMEAALLIFMPVEIIVPLGLMPIMPCLNPGLVQVGTLRVVIIALLILQMPNWRFQN